MKEKLMTLQEIQEEIKFEDECGMNTLLQNFLHFKESVNYFRVFNNKGEICGYKIRNKKTKEKCQL